MLKVLSVFSFALFLGSCQDADTFAEAAPVSNTIFKQHGIEKIGPIEGTNCVLYYTPTGYYYTRAPLVVCPQIPVECKTEEPKINSEYRLQSKHFNLE